MKTFLPLFLLFSFLTLACKKKDSTSTQTPVPLEAFEISYNVTTSGTGKWEYMEFEYINDNGTKVVTKDTLFFTFNKSFTAQKGFNSRLFIKGSLRGKGEVTVSHQVRNAQKKLVHDYYKSYAIEKGKLEYQYETQYENK